MVCTLFHDQLQQGGERPNAFRAFVHRWSSHVRRPVRDLSEWPIKSRYVEKLIGRVMTIGAIPFAAAVFVPVYGLIKAR